LVGVVGRLVDWLVGWLVSYYACHINDKELVCIIYSSGSQSVLRGLQGMRVYISVMATLKFTFSNKRNNVVLKIIGEIL
jgi:hypothetical protein